MSQAGLKGRVTIATNMAGRGTDIKPIEDVLAAGGVHVLGTERHEALRIDRQLAGRAGRQGDPGSSQFFLSLDDELLEGLGTSTKDSWEAFGQRGGDRDWDRYRYLFEKAQRKMERRHYISPRGFDGAREAPHGNTEGPGRGPVCGLRRMADRIAEELRRRAGVFR